MAFCKETGKICYPTREYARETISYDRSAHKSNKYPRKVYKCKFCGQYHLTSGKKLSVLRHKKFHDVNFKK